MQRWHGKHVFDRLEAKQVGGSLAPINPWGNHFYVDDTLGNDNNKGTEYDDAKLTMQAAIDLCTANMGDIIHVAKGTLTVTTPVLFNKRGITVIADDLFNPDANGEDHTIYGSHTDGPAAIITEPCRIIGMGFVGSKTAGPSLLFDAEEAVGYSAAYSHLLHCRFQHWGIAKAHAIETIGGQLNLIEECFFDGGFVGWGQSAILLGHDTGAINAWQTHIKNCTFMGTGDQTIYCIELKAASLPAAIRISGNVIVPMKIESATLKGKFLNTNGRTGTGHIWDNWLGLATDTVAYDISVTDLQTAGYLLSGNHYAE